jgi:hypothetical protein
MDVDSVWNKLVLVTDDDALFAIGCLEVVPVDAESTEDGVDDGYDRKDETICGLSTR